ncbi:hypothetical protein [Cardinium endosymbiont of Culicoides punctatus]|uniref:hypothetical protein n=1 Tax=Cardinium endosymbiont of Culicoides punctatus TaxID=2304601 RepID=UPI001058B897|nr:hypothetical protein [Cardinium endosymbiont of Culicoides punctatus]TDG95638.1 hypothetical protein CCPUN_00920 [Cardinium endosymbiont of Culicoides punctatus]
MRKYGVFLLQIIAIFCPCIVNALHSFDDYIEQIYQRHNFTEEQDFESIREALQDAYAVPLDLNNISQEELSSLGILYEDQIKNYFNHIAHTGALYALYEYKLFPVLI